VTEAAVAVLIGGALAIGRASAGAADDGANARRAQLERELARAAPALTEYARLERAGQAAKASAEQAAARARPSARWLALFEALSGEAPSGVAVSRLQGSNTEIELHVSAPDSAACVAWMDRLRRVRGAESVEMVDLKSTASVDANRAGEAMTAVVRLRWRGEGPTRPVRRTAYGERGLAERVRGTIGDGLSGQVGGRSAP
jgi:Tfp pilus assembly protein PilN